MKKSSKIRFLAGGSVFAVSIGLISSSTQSARALDLKYFNPVYWFVCLENMISYFFSMLSNAEDVKMEQKIIKALNLIFSAENVSIKNKGEKYKVICVTLNDRLLFEISIQRLSLHGEKYVAASLKNSSEERGKCHKIKSTKDLRNFVGDVIKLTKNFKKNVSSEKFVKNAPVVNNAESDIKMEQNIIEALNLIFQEENVEVKNIYENYKEISIHVNDFSFTIPVHRVVSLGNEEKYVAAILGDSNEKRGILYSIKSTEDLRNFVGDVIAELTKNSEKNVEEIYEEYNDFSESME